MPASARAGKAAAASLPTLHRFLAEGEAEGRALTEDEAGDLLLTMLFGA